MDATTIWTILTGFFTNFFTAAESLLTSIMGNATIATMVIGIPLFSIITGMVLKLANLRRGRRRGR